jgi:hypothetical protein
MGEDYVHYGESDMALKFSRLCPVVLIKNVCWTKGKALGIEQVN